MVTIEETVPIGASASAASSSSSVGAFARSSTVVVAKLTKSTGKAMWMFGTSCLLLAVPLFLAMDREAQLVEMENQQMGVLTGDAAQGTAAAASTST
mmetsp:Transcript_7110/g.26148  ORF Transcript_7110/g.26148 Transcript_7110/m.26148 type:complete len:97 (-) Transcript_7110:122-412(-)